VNQIYATEKGVLIPALASSPKLNQWPVIPQHLTSLLLV